MLAAEQQEFSLEGILIAVAIGAVVLAIIVWRSIIATRWVRKKCREAIEREFRKHNLEPEHVPSAPTMVAIGNKYNASTPLKLKVTYHDSQGIRREAAFKFRFLIAAFALSMENHGYEVDPPLDAEQKKDQIAGALEQAAPAGQANDQIADALKAAAED